MPCFWITINNNITKLSDAVLYLFWMQERRWSGVTLCCSSSSSRTVARSHHPTRRVAQSLGLSWMMSTSPSRWRPSMGRRSSCKYGQPDWASKLYRLGCAHAAGGGSVWWLIMDAEGFQHYFTILHVVFVRVFLILKSCKCECELVQCGWFILHVSYQHSKIKLSELFYSNIPTYNYSDDFVNFDWPSCVNMSVMDASMKSWFPLWARTLVSSGWAYTVVLLVDN